ncbi:hypothetical protein E3T54_05160, partial [Cryobacterium sp. Sr8]|uniref:hypothetical protein n=1 Tax=Cryobacterium sp. Sr8 TaxID=1259203 RepID=UPI00110180C7
MDEFDEGFGVDLVGAAGVVDDFLGSGLPFFVDEAGAAAAGSGDLGEDFEKEGAVFGVEVEVAVDHAVGLAPGAEVLGGAQGVGAGGDPGGVDLVAGVAGGGEGLFRVQALAGGNSAIGGAEVRAA